MTQNPSESESKKTPHAYDLADLGIGTSDAGTAHSDTEYSLEDFLPILVNLLMPRRHLTATPTFTPKSFVDSIQLFDDGTNRRIYLYINKSWRYAALT
jgi:hypothetical protein